MIEGYTTVQDMAKKWNLNERTIQVMCSEGRINGVTKFGRACIDEKGRENHVLIMKVEASAAVHTNQADEAYLRVGDKSKLLKFEERLQLSYDKGERYFEDKAVADATIDDLDMVLVKEYIEKIGYSKTPEDLLIYMNINKSFLYLCYMLS